MIKHVADFEELAAAPFAAGINALCLKRTLAGDFGEVVSALDASEPINVLDEDLLRGLRLGAGGQQAVAVLLEDLQRLQELGRDPVLNLITGYPQDDSAEASPRSGAFARDVFSFHADSAPVEADTWLCTYHGSPSEGLLNEDAVRKVDVPEIRAQLLELYHQATGNSPQVAGPRFQVSAFNDWLRENCYDLHYAPKPGATPYSFGVGHLWRIAVDWPGSSVPPCVHRAPATIPGEPRLLLIC